MLAHDGKLHIVVYSAGGLTRYKPTRNDALENRGAELNDNLLSALFSLPCDVSLHAGKRRAMHQ